MCYVVPLAMQTSHFQKEQISAERDTAGRHALRRPTTFLPCSGCTQLAAPSQIPYKLAALAISTQS